MDAKNFEGFGVKNFKLLKDYYEFEFKDISILTGTNNSGKSSLIKALLLLYDSKKSWSKSEIYLERLNFYEGSHGISGMKSALHNPKAGLTFSIKHGDFSFHYEFDNKGELSFNYKICKSEKLVLQSGVGTQIYFPLLIEYLEDCSKNSDIDFKIVNSLIESIKKYLESNPEYFNLYLDDTTFGLIPFISYDIQSNYDRNPSDFNKYEGTPPSFGADESDLELEVNFNYIFSEILKSNKVSKKLFEVIFPPANPNYNFLPDIFYLPSSKGKIKRSYSTEDLDFGKEIIKSSVEKRSPLIRNWSFWKVDVDNWFKEFGIGKIEPKYDEVQGTYSITIDGRSIVDYGLGAAQIVFLLLWMSNIESSGWRGEYKPLIILEEPEANLHPAFQSKLMEFIVELSQKSYFQFIIETHSEYMIRKLQYLTAKNKIKHKNSIIYYFNAPKRIPKNEKQIKKLNIRADGMMDDDFGAGFFDESTRLAIDLLKLQN